jgi:hypothetical protein
MATPEKTLAQEIAALRPVIRRLDLDAQATCENMRRLCDRLEKLSDDPRFLEIASELRQSATDLGDVRRMVTEREERIMNLFARGAALGETPATVGRSHTVVELPADPYAAGMEALARMESDEPPKQPPPSVIGRLLMFMRLKAR